jgi:hypothetical protein
MNKVSGQKAVGRRVVFVARRPAAPQATAQYFTGSWRFPTLVPPLVRGGVVAARPPLPNKA